MRSGIEMCESSWQRIMFSRYAHYFARQSDDSQKWHIWSLASDLKHELGGVVARSVPVLVRDWSVQQIVMCEE